VVDAIKGMAPRIDTPVLFPAARGGRIDLEKFRHRDWAPALRAADVKHRRVYDCRHTFASWAIAGGVSLFHLSKIMGTSTALIGDYSRYVASSRSSREVEELCAVGAAPSAIPA
jgi:integrase